MNSEKQCPRCGRETPPAKCFRAGVRENDPTGRGRIRDKAVRGTVSNLEGNAPSLPREAVQTSV